MRKASSLSVLRFDGNGASSGFFRRVTVGMDSKPRSSHHQRHCMVAYSSRRRIVLLVAMSLASISCAAAAASSVALRTSSSSTAGTPTPGAAFCGSSACCCSVQDELKLQEAFLTEVNAHGYEDAACRSDLKAYMCAVCTNATAAINTTTSSALRLRCARAAAARSVPTRHDLDNNNGVGGRSPTPSTPPLCVHKAWTQAYDGVVPLKDGSGRLLCWRRNGEIWLAMLDVDPKLLIHLGSRVSLDAARGRGLAGVAVHSATGQLFVSYYTNTVGPDGVRAFLVVDQLSSSASSWSEHDEVQSNRVDPTTTTTRVFSMALPQEEPRSSPGFLLDYYGGQILFRPNNSDPFLYLVTGPGDGHDQLQAKILRFRVGQDMPSGNGNDTEVYAAGLGIPRRCAFDTDRPQHLYCAILKEEQELVYLISDSDSDAPSSSGSATPPSSSRVVAHHRPVPGTLPSLVGGQLYDGDADKTLTGSYIYIEGSEFWWMVASPARNYTATRNLRVTCAAPASTTSPCRGDDFAANKVTSFAEDADKNVLLLTTDGAYMVVRPSLCTEDAASTNNNLLSKIIGVIGGLIAILGGGYGTYKFIVTCSCFHKTTNIIVNVFYGGNNQIHHKEAEPSSAITSSR